MARPLRLEFPGAVYHVTARGDAREDIFLDDDDRRDFLDRLGREIEQQRWRCPAYCLMGNHYHLLIETPEPNLARGMRRLNGTYTQSFNRRHARVGHVLQGRYGSVLVQRESHLLALCRYVVLNPVRAGLVQEPGDWSWSSFRATVGEEPLPRWLDVAWVLAQFSAHTPHAQRAYRQFVVEGRDGPSPWRALRGQIWLGDEEFLGRMQARVAGMALEGVPEAQRRPARPSAERVVAEVAMRFGVDPASLRQPTHRDAMRAAVYLLRRAANVPLREVAKWAGISPGRVSQIQREIEDGSQSEHLPALCARLGLGARAGTQP